MSFARDMGSRGAASDAGRSSQSATPGKATLTGAMSGAQAPRAASEPGKATLTGAMSDELARRRKPASRDVDLGPAHGAAPAPQAAHPPAAEHEPAAQPARGGGAHVAATVMTSTAETEVAWDNVFTPALVAALKADPKGSIDEAMERLASRSLARYPEQSIGLQHPTIVQYGREAGAGGGRAPRSTRKRAVLIANEEYDQLSRLRTPKAEAAAMQGELTARGYQAEVHHDQSAPQMAALWGGLVGSARRGDDLVAAYGGHGMPEGLAGVHHAHPPGPRDVLSHAQISGVVGTATDHSAHIRVVIDACHAGGAAQAVREERENHLAQTAGGMADELRLAAMTGLRTAKQRLLALMDACSALDGRGARNVSVPRDIYVPAFERAVDRAWRAFLPQLEVLRMIAGVAAPPPPIGDATLGAQLNYLDALWNAVAHPVETAAADRKARLGR